jgi:hypothetical protein
MTRGELLAGVIVTFAFREPVDFAAGRIGSAEDDAVDLYPGSRAAGKSDHRPNFIDSK